MENENYIRAYLSDPLVINPSIQSVVFPEVEETVENDLTTYLREYLGDPR